MTDDPADRHVNFRPDPANCWLSLIVNRIVSGSSGQPGVGPRPQLSLAGLVGIHAIQLLPEMVLSQEGCPLRGWRTSDIRCSSPAMSLIR